MLQRLGGGVYVLFVRPGESADGGMLDQFGDLDHGVEIPGARDGKSSFDDVDAQLVQPFCNDQFLWRIQLAARHLLSIS